MVIFEIATGIGYRARDGIAMRAGRRVIQAGDHACFYSPGDKVFQATSFLMHLMPLHAQHINQEALGQAVTA